MKKLQQTELFKVTASEHLLKLSTSEVDVIFDNFSREVFNLSASLGSPILAYREINSAIMELEFRLMKKKAA